jgi:hypothetical protein
MNSDYSNSQTSIYNLGNNFVVCYKHGNQICYNDEGLNFEILTFNIRSTHISTLKGTFIVAKVYIFVYSGIYLNTASRSTCTIPNNYF